MSLYSVFGKLLIKIENLQGNKNYKIKKILTKINLTKTHTQRSILTSPGFSLPGKFAFAR